MMSVLDELTLCLRDRKLQLDGVDIPPMSRSVMVDIDGDQQYLRAILVAYYRPEETFPCLPPHEDRRRYIAGDVSLVVTSDGCIIGVGSFDPDSDGDGEPAWNTDESPRRYRRGKGGSGTRIPTTIEELLEIAKSQGAEPVRTQKHWRVRLPNGQCVTVANTSSDWRALANMVREFRRRGMDVRRPA